MLVGNRPAWLCIATLVVLQIAYTYLPPFHVWFGSVPFSWAQWATALGYGLACFLLIEAVKAFSRLLVGGQRRT